MNADTTALRTFDIIDDPWLDVLRTDGSVETLSLRDLLKDTHRIARLSESSPLTEVALLRFLIALVSDGLRERIPTDEDWQPFVEQCRDGLPDGAMDDILAPLVGQSDVLDPEHDGFFDGPAIRRVTGWNDPKSWQPVSRFLPELPTGTNLAHFSHISDEASALCVGCLLKGRAVDAAFARGGLGPSLSRNLLATIGGTEPRYVVPVGGSLLETILLNVTIGDRNRPSWISIHSSKNGDPGPIARMTWKPRLLMPVDSSQTDLPCICCATVDRPRFTQAVMVDTYNQKGGPFGTKSDVERWKTAGGDPHLLPFAKNAITLGQRPEEWPLRAMARSLAGGAAAVFDDLPRRAAVTIGPIAVAVTSSTGNQAKIDGAPHATLSIPTELLARSIEDRAKIAEALTAIFDKPHGERRRQLIPDQVSQLLSELATSEKPSDTVQAWLGGAKPRPHGDEYPTETPLNDKSHYDAAKRLINRLSRLPRHQLAALRSLGLGGSHNHAARQAAFEAVWHRQGLPVGSRRHALREALATVAPIYAIHSESHHPSRTPRSFESRLRCAVGSESRLDHGPVSKLLSQVVSASPAARDDLLRRLVGAVISSGRTSRASIDFGDLLLEVACWNDPFDPTPVRWKEVLKVRVTR